MVVYAAASIFARILFAFIHVFIANGTLPAGWTSAGEGGVVHRWTTHSSPLAWMRGTGNQLHLTVFPCEWWTALAGVAVDSINTSALVQTGPGCTFIYVLLTVHTSVSRLA